MAGTCSLWSGWTIKHISKCLIVTPYGFVNAEQSTPSKLPSSVCEVKQGNSPVDEGGGL